MERAFFDFVCLKLLVSKLLSYGIICGAVLVKVPQIVKIVRSKSTAGLAPSMYVLENIGYLITVIYNLRNGYAFSTFGEAVFLLLQGFVLVALFGVFNKRLGLTVAGASVFAAFAYFLGQVATPAQLAQAQMATIPIFAASRLPQIARNYQAGSTGVLSLVTVLLNALGSSARVFTTLTEVQDQVVLMGVCSSAIMNLVLLLQLALYWNADAAKAKAAPVKGASSSAGSSKKGKQGASKPSKQE